MINPNQTLLQIVNHVIVNCPPLVPTIKNLTDNQYVTKAIEADKSYGNERELLEKFVGQLNNTNSGFVVDIAASDGVTMSSTLGLFKREGWKGLAVEMDPVKFSHLACIYAQFKGAKLARNRITPNNIVNLLNTFDVPLDFTVLNLDIDSYDLFVIDRMLENGFRPKIITMEINEKIPPGIFFTVEFDEKHYWKEDHFYGCSIDAASETVKKYGYRLVRLEYNNVFFVTGDAPPSLGHDLKPALAYNEGYLNRSDRKQLFPWNQNVEHWLHWDLEKVIFDINLHFKSYQGLFSLRIM
jgi:hypothetical protein